MPQRNAIIIGASSGIGRELAKVLAENGYGVGLVARREPLLASLAREISTPTFIKVIDISDPETAIPRLRELIAEMGDVDLFVLNSGTGHLNDALDWEPERETIAVNVAGFTALTGVAVAHLTARGSGHIVGISSIAALRGGRAAPAYNASKAFMSSYLQGLRQKFAKAHLPIVVTDIQPGFVDTPMAKGDGKFWVAPAEVAARQIFTAIRKGKAHAYVTRRWRLIAWVLKLLPDALYNRM